MKFSVLLSVYRAENPLFLDTCLHSIWTEQTRKPDQIVLVKDGTLTQQLEDCLTKWQHALENVLEIVPLQDNVGLGKALAAGLSACKHQWIFRMDTDDICVPDRFAKQTAFIAAHPDIALFGGQIIEFTGDIRQGTFLKPVPEQDSDIHSFAKKRNPFNHMTVAYRKDVVMAVGNYQHHPFMEDYNLWLRILAAGYRTANMGDVLVYARTDNGMHGRRRGTTYIRSEKELMNCKIRLGIQTPPSAFLLFVIRSCLRLLPKSLLTNFYNRLMRTRQKPQ